MKAELAKKLYEAHARATLPTGAAKIRPFKEADGKVWGHVAESALAYTCNPEACEHIATNAKAFQDKLADLEKRHAAEIKKVEERRVRMEIEQVDPTKELDEQMSTGIKIAAGRVDLDAMAKLCELRLELLRMKADPTRGPAVTCTQSFADVDEPEL